MNRILSALLLVCLSLVETSTAATLETRSTTSPDGLTISYVEGGNGPLTLVFVHGWTCDHSYWREQLSVFARDYRVIAPDLAGHGDSALGRQHYSMASFGADVAAAAKGEGPVVLIGHSMGGPVILQAALQLGDRVRGIVAVDTLRDVQAPMTSDNAIAARVAPLEADYAATAGQFLAAMFVEESDPELQRLITEDMLATDHTVGVDAIRGMLQSDNAAALHSIDAPLVIINSSYQPTDLAKVVEHHPDTQLKIMDGVGHFVMMEDPETFNALLRQAIESF